MSQLSDIWTLIGIVFVAWFVLVAFFTPRIDYRISAPPEIDIDEFLLLIQATLQAASCPGTACRSSPTDRSSIPRCSMPFVPPGSP